MKISATTVTSARCTRTSGRTAERVIAACATNRRKNAAQRGEKRERNRLSVLAVFDVELWRLPMLTKNLADGAGNNSVASHRQRRQRGGHMLKEDSSIGGAQGASGCHDGGDFGVGERERTQ
jgi:hypothetical protein